MSSMVGRKTNKPTSASASAVVALGASGGFVGGLLTCLAQIGTHAAAAIVIILHHREALDEAGFRRALMDARLSLSDIEDGAPIEGGKIYMPAADLIVTAENGCFQTRPAEQQPGARGTIDSFLVSLAENEDGNTIAVFFAHTGGDGTLGAGMVKEWGGLVLAEATDETNPHALDTSQNPAALADVILRPAELAERIKAHIEQIAAQSGASKERAPGQTPAALASIAAVLRNKTGHDFHGYKDGTFWRRIQRRMQVLQAGTVDEYLGILRSHPDEPQNLFNDLLIGVTQFFRDRREFELVENEVIPRLFEEKSRADALRVWVIGCSTGEEAYSLAILLREQMAKLDDFPQVQVFATDLDGRALASARAGRFTEAATRELSPERLARWFVKQGNTYMVVKELREMCIFSQHSIVKDAPFSRLDLISCRNLLIYLDPELQTKVIPLFHFALKSKGYLFLGNSENISRHTTLFSPIESRSRVFRRLDTERRVLPDFPFTAVNRGVIAPAAPPQTAPVVPRDLGRTAERIAERHAPAYVIVDADSNVLHFSGRSGRFIEPAVGAATLNIFNLVHPALRLDLRAALNQAAETKEAARAPGLRVGIDGAAVLVDLVVEPLQEKPDAPRIFVVLFKDGSPVAETGDGEGENSKVSAAHVRRLEAELSATTERLQATVEELESTNEELKSANEEYQSLNEELQSANEELETSKEELQSINEELTTVNGELGHRVQELGRANSDLKNFFESTQIATVFVDNEMKVMNYTPAITDIFHLVDSDIGRPIGHIKSQLAFDDLPDDVTRVLRTLAIQEREVANPVSGARYVMRILPYRSTDNFIAGAVVTFLDITERKKAEEALRDREERFRLILESARDYAIFTADLDGTITEWPAGAAAVFGWTAEEAVGQKLDMLYVPEDRDNLAPEQELAAVRARGFAPNVGWHLRKGGKRVFIEGSARALNDAAGKIRGVLKIGQDVSERRRTDAALRESEESFRAVADLVPDLLWSSDAQGKAEWFNRRWLDYTGLAPEDTSDEGWLAAVQADDRDQVRAQFRQSVLSGEPFSLQYRITGSDGGERWFLTRAQPTHDAETGAITHWFGSATDVHDQRLSMQAIQQREAEAKLLLAELQHRVRNTLGVVRSIARRTALTSKSVEDYAMHLDGRLNTFARVQSIVTRNPHEGVDLEYLIAEELNAHAAREGGQVNELAGPRVMLQPKAAELVGLAIHELTVNAVKYGALEQQGGSINVSWSFDERGGEQALVIEWREEGVRVPAADKRGAGFGTELLERTLAYELSGETRIEFRPDGITCVLTIPVTDRLIVPRVNPKG